jgi:histidinol phosphatase-like PHP family hydrolase
MTTPTSDWHIHSRNSCDSACLVVEELIRDAADAGITDFGLTDHLHTPYNLPDIVMSRDEFVASMPHQRFHFGIEVSCVSQWELTELANTEYPDPVYGLRAGGPESAAPAIALTSEDIKRYEIEYVVAGTHWPLYVPLEREPVIRDYHRQNMYLATHPLVDIVAHPWWWMGHWQDDDGCYRTGPWLDNFDIVPKSMHEEFAAAAIEHGTAIEINIYAILANMSYPIRFKEQYAEYIAYLNDAGVSLSIGSDCHGRHYENRLEDAAHLLESTGVKRSELWTLPPRDATQS